MIGGDVDLYLLSLFPQIDSTSMGGIESRASFFQVNNGGVRVERSNSPRRKKGTFYSPLQNMTVMPTMVVPLLPAVVPFPRKYHMQNRLKDQGGTTG
jgi:hypothetical protein